MSIKDLFNSKGSPKIQKSVTTEELVDQVESSDFVEAKRTQFDEFVPPIDFSTATNFAKFGSAELYYEKSFERIYQYYPYDGTLHEKIEFENSSSYLDKYVFDYLYPRTNGYLNFNSSSYISVFGGPHTASAGMTGKPLDSTFDLSMKYDEEKKRTSAFEFRGEDGITAEFWYKTANTTGQKTILHVSGVVGDIEVKSINTDLKLIVNSGSVQITDKFATITDTDWNYYAVTLLSSSAGLTTKGYKNGQEVQQVTNAKNIPSLLPTTDCLNMRIGRRFDNDKIMTGSLDEFRFWKTARSSEDIFNTWFIPVGGGTNKFESNIALSCYFKFNEGITGNSALDSQVLDYSGRINNGTIENFTTALRETGSAITEKLSEPEFKDPIIYSSHPDVIAKKLEYKTSGSLADLESTSMFNSYFPGWMQEEDEQNGSQMKHLSQVLGSYFDTLWHQIDFVNRVHDQQYVSGSNKPLPFAKKLLYDQGFVIPDLFVDATKIENLRQKDDNEVFEKEINEVRNTIYHNIYNNLDGIYKTKGTEKSFRNFFRSIGIGQDVVKLKMYADDSTFVLRDNYEYKSYERKFVDFNIAGHFDSTIYQTSSANNSNIYIPGDSNFTGSFTVQSEILLPRKQRKNEPNYSPYPYLSSSLFGYHSGQSYTHPATDYGLQAYVVHSTLESNLSPDDEQRVKFVLTGSGVNLESDWYWGEYENNKWSLAIRVKDSSYPNPNTTGSVANDYLIEFYGVEADGDTERNSFLLATSSVAHSYFSSDKIFYAGSHKTNFIGSTLQYTDIKLGYLRYWHSYLSNDAIKQHAFDSETFGANEPFEQDLFDTYPVEIPREKTLGFHWAFNDLTSSNSSGEFLITDLSSGSVTNNYGSLSPTIEKYVAGQATGFTASSSKVLDKNYLYSARKRLPDDLMSSDLTTIKSEETEQFFVDEDVSDNFYSFEKSMWGAISDEMMNMFSTALDMNNLIGQSNQKYHHKYGMAEFLRDRFFDDVENEPDIEKFTSFYKWIDDSISIALQQLTPASARFSEKINNVIESHVLERNKYVHQIPILTNFESTEGSIKGISEMKYNWRFGHAPTDTDDEANNCLWQQDRKEKEGFRETVRNSRNNHSIQSSGLIRREIDGTARISDTYSVRRFAKTYDVSMVSQNTIHGGTNFGRRKNLELFRESILPAGELGSVSGVPQNVIVVGVGHGYGVVPEQICNDDAPTKRKINVDANLGKYTGQEYGHELLGDFMLPMNVMTGTISTGFNSVVSSSYKSDVHFTNLHNDIVGNSNDIPMQGPFTDNHVGGLQYRHIDMNQYDATTGRINEEQDRPEGWGLVVGVHPVTDPDSDGAFGFVPADYEDPYPSATAKKATRYRDETAKRPVNLKNIKTVSGSWKVGNYKNELEIFQVSPTFQKTWAVEAYSDPSVNILPPSIASALPLTTHYQSLMGYSPLAQGNTFGVYGNNRQVDSELISPETAGTPANGSFVVTGSPNPIVTASGSFDVLGTEVEGTFATGSFEVTGNTVLGTFASGSFTMSGTFSPAVSASFGFTALGKTTLAVPSSASFSVSGTIVNAAAATASFDVSGLPRGGSNAYSVFNASYQMATDEHVNYLGRNGDTNGVEIDWNNSTTAGNTSVSPVTFQKAAEVSGSTEFFSGSASFDDNAEFIMNFWVSASKDAIDASHTDRKFLYDSVSSGGRHLIQVYFNSGSNPDGRHLVLRRYTSMTSWYEYQSVDEVADDSGLDWTMLTVTAHGGTETKLYVNATSSALTRYDFNSPGGGTFGFESIDKHYVMSNQEGDSQWSGDARISDFIMWNKSISDDPTRLEFVQNVYRDGNFQPAVPSGSLVGWQYTFGDDPSDQIRTGLPSIIDITTSGSNLTASYDDSFEDSLFALKKTSTEYFDDLKTALETHNSDGSYFSVSYEPYTEVASSALNSAFYYQTDNDAFKPGQVFPIAIGSTLNYARFFVRSSAESAAANYNINPSVSNSGKTGQSRSFINVSSSATGSAQENAMLPIENTSITINTDPIAFNNHNNAQSGDKIATFTTTASCVQGSSTTNSARFSNTSYPSNSILYGTDRFSVSFWKSHAAQGTNETVWQIESSTDSAAVLIYTDDNSVYFKLADSDRDTKIWSRTFADIGINETDMNHFAWTYLASDPQPTLYVNSVSQSSLTAVDNSFAGFNDKNIVSIHVAGNSANTTDELRGRLSQLSIWSGSMDSTIVNQVYNDGRPKDLYEISYGATLKLAHWYKLSDELPVLGSNLSSVTTIEDASLQPFPVDLTVNNGGDFTVGSGIATDTIPNADFWTALNSSIDSNVTDYTAENTSGDFTVSYTSTGPAGNGDALSTTSALISNLETTTSGGVDQAGAVDGDELTIATINFIVDDDNTADTSSNKHIQFTGSNTAIWNALSQSIKDNSVFGNVTIIDNGSTATFQLTSSTGGASNNVAMTETGTSYGIVHAPAGGINHTGAIDGHYVNLRPNAVTADTRLFTVDTTGTKVDNTPAKYRYVNPVVASDTLWWNALEAKIEAEGYAVSYVADNPSAGTASFTVTSYLAAAAGNSGVNNLFSGNTFVNTGATAFAGGLDASGSISGDTLVVDGTTFTMVAGAPGSSTQVSVTGSSEALFEDMRAKIQSETGFNAVTASSGIPRTFDLTSKVTGSSEDPNISETGETFTFVSETTGTTEAGAQNGDSITVSGSTYTVSGLPAASTSQFHNDLSQSIKDNTDFDTITITDLGTGYHRFELTASVTGSASNDVITQNSVGPRTTFQNLLGTAGGTDEAGAEAGDTITIESLDFYIVDGAPAGPRDISTTGSTSEFHAALSQSIKNNTSFDTITLTDLGDGYNRFDITSSAVGAAGNSTLSQNSIGVRSTFRNLVGVNNGANASGIVDQASASIGAFTFVLTASAPSDTSTTSYIETNTDSATIWASLESKIEARGYTVDVTKTGTTSALFEITSSATGSAQNVTALGLAPTFTSVTSPFTGGTNITPAIYNPLDNIIATPRTDLTGSQRNIVTRFSAPGGPEVQTISYLDAYTQTHTVHNAMPFRNLTVLGSGSGEEGTIRVEDHLGLRRGLRTLRGLHMGQFGIDSQYGEITSGDYPSSGSFNKQFGNVSNLYQWNSSTDITASLSESNLITGSNYDNAFINTPIPRSELQYSWIHNATSGAAGTTYGAPVQRILGYAPTDGIISSSAGFVEAIVFPSASSIFGS